MATKRVYFFGAGKAEGHIGMKDVLGGKGAALAEMSTLGVSVPPGFTISTEVCNLFYRNRGRIPTEVNREIAAHLARLEKVSRKKFGDPKNPLLVSVRSGARYSMPGMMDTILNLGMNGRTAEGLARATKNERFAFDAYRRFLMTFSTVVLGIERRGFEELFERVMRERGAASELELTAGDLRRTCKAFEALVRETTRGGFPGNPLVQLALARDAVFRSWNNDRARYYRKASNIPDDIGTAVTVQAMVFGNLGNDCATGVAFTRNPATGAREFYGEYLVDAQGDDVVAGGRTPRRIADLKKEMPRVFEQLVKIAARLEKRFGDVQDVEFTVEHGRLHILQTRTAKRTAAAAVKIAVDMVREKRIGREEALMRLDPRTVEQLLRPVIDAKARVDVVAKGLPASPGAATGAVVFHADRAVELASTGRAVILVRKETRPDDVHGMDAAHGILTARGGMTSHAAVIARHLGKPCIVGCEAIDVDETTNRFVIGGRVVHAGDLLTLNGGTGEVILGEVPLVAPKTTVPFVTFMAWADSVRKLAIRADADTPSDARTARLFGAQGIGLCRTEPMFFAPDRIPIVQAMLLARTGEEREKALGDLLPMQREDFRALFREMNGWPVAIRLLDPPLSVFLPRRGDLVVEVTKLELIHADRSIIEEKKRMLDRVEELNEANPLLGLRGCRLGIVCPEVVRMQVRALFEAACEAAREGIRVQPEVMIPLVGMVAEMKAQRELVVEVATETMKRYKRKVSYAVGAMIELPRAALTADQIAREAEFFSFAAGDLTQTTYGLSRDDSGKVLHHYLSRSELCPRCGGKLGRDRSCPACGVSYPARPENILDFDVFSTLDRDGVGQLIRMGLAKARAVRPKLTAGVCGEQAGDPASVEFFHGLGLDYVSCSPYRVPVSRLAAAQAVLRARAAASSARKKKR